MCDQLQAKKTGLAEDLKKVVHNFKEAKMYWQSAEEEVRQAGEIVFGNPYIQHIFGRQGYAELTQIWHDSKFFANLPQSSARTHLFYRGQYDPEHGEDRAFWA